MVGQTASQGAGRNDGWIVRLDKTGKRLWEKTFGGPGFDVFMTVSPLPDKGFIVGGLTQTKSKGGLDGWIVAVDYQGKVLWETTAGGAKHDGIKSSIRMPEGGTLLAGYTESQGKGRRNAWLIKVDDAGKVLWEKVMGGEKREEFSSIAAVPGGGYLVAGISKSFGAGNADGWLVRLDQSGQKSLWSKTYGDAKWNALSFGQSTPSGGFILAGNTQSNPANQSDMWVVKVDSKGKMIWQKAFGGKGMDFATSIFPLKNDGFLLSGSTLSKGAGKYDAWLIGLDSKGQQSWERTLGQSENDGLTRLETLSSGGFIAAGFSAKPGKTEDFDGWVLLLDEQGKVP